MGCNCGGRTPEPGSPNRPSGTEPGQWVVVYPSGRREMFTGGQARRRAQREAIATGGQAHKI